MSNNKIKKHSPLYQYQQMSLVGGVCKKCGKDFPTLNVDHVFPWSLLTMWGLGERGATDEDNLELICRSCNVLKHARFDFSNPKTIPLIEKYIKILKETYESRSIQ